VAEAKSYTEAAKAAGRRSGDAIWQLVWRFNREGLAALEPGHGGGRRTIYAAPERERILAEVRRKPEREEDGSASWSLSTLRRALRKALRKAQDGLPVVSTPTPHLEGPQRERF
jgi:transposase